MGKGITFNSFEKVTISNIYPPEGIYFFYPIFENSRICPMLEYSVPEKKIMDICLSEFEIRLSQTTEEKKSNMNRRPKMRLKKFPKTTLLHI